MFTYTRLPQQGDFIFHLAEKQTQGTMHCTITPDPDMTKENRATVNIYMDGEIEFSIPDTGFSQTMSSGTCSLDVNLDVYPAMSVMRETVVTDTASRYCVSHAEGKKYAKTLVELANEQYTAPATSTVMVLSGTAILGTTPMNARDIFVMFGGQTTQVNGRILVLTSA